MLQITSIKFWPALFLKGYLNDFLFMEQKFFIHLPPPTSLSLSLSLRAKFFM